MLADIESQVDRSDSKLNSAMKKMKHFIRETEGELSILAFPYWSLTCLVFRNEIWMVHRHFNSYTMCPSFGYCLGLSFLLGYPTFCSSAHALSHEYLSNCSTNVTQQYNTYTTIYLTLGRRIYTQQPRLRIFSHATSHQLRSRGSKDLSLSMLFFSTASR